MNDGIQRVTMAKSTLLKRAKEAGLVLCDLQDEPVHIYDLAFTKTRKEGEVSIVSVTFAGDLFLSFLASGG